MGAMLAFATLSGCATYACRVARAGLHGVYPASHLDVGYFDYVRHEEKGSWLLPSVVGLGVVLDLPFSLITDTLFLPIDLKHKQLSGGVTEEPTDKIDGQPSSPDYRREAAPQPEH